MSSRTIFIYFELAPISSVTGIVVSNSCFPLPSHRRDSRRLQPTMRGRPSPDLPSGLARPPDLALGVENPSSSASSQNARVRVSDS